MGNANYNVLLACCAGKTYRFRISNVGLTTSINFRIQGHKMLLVEVEGIHTLQNTYDSLDIHLGQSYSVLVTADQPPQDYYIVVSTRFTSQVLTATSILHYSNSATSVSGLSNKYYFDSYSCGSHLTRYLSSFTTKLYRYCI